MIRFSLCLLFIFSLTFHTEAAETAKAESVEWKAGVASAKITPAKPLRMAGYAGRKEPAEGTEQDLYGKALAIEDQEGNRVVFVTLDLIGVIDRLRADVSKQVQEKYNLPPQALLMNASHTHCGPAYGRDDAKEYYDTLVPTLVKTIGEAIEEMQPANLSWSAARCSVAMNRRTPTATGYRNHPNPNGRVDHQVPVLRVDDPKGELKAVMFGYACHNTTMGFRKWLGDYAGFAQEYFEKDHPGVTALFMMGCGGDQNPYPRSELHYAHKHGRALATAIEAALEVNQRTLLHQHVLHGPLKTAYGTVELEYLPEKKREPWDYPVQVIQFGNDLTIVALGTEVVVDYALRIKQELFEQEGPAIWVAGYSNVYSGYIPSKRVLLEGGYEASRPYKPDVEERIIGKVLELNAGLESAEVK
ncbi:neutral/alkaline non-lysosomal ceramidase N-terminal domain-containing protein [uncultured Gimesia sp.]|uniref:neutral/alkaline non-lysosomal ceramidase N-terminal domain-containing protein n=1 Tax=uncultured Gimesia sp. TaxID=1678688 RepID=UPI0030D9E810|tara:strand:+ start:5764 stop:7011 length:1248 start_codon:yes stop_codon:yes gene_type:complete